MKWVKANPSLVTDLPRLSIEQLQSVRDELWGKKSDGKNDDDDAFDIPDPSPSPVRVRLSHVYCEEAEANAVVNAWHRHHKPPQGRRYSLKCLDENGVIRGVVIVGRPVARNTCRRSIVEVTRVCTDGTPNACSYLYGAAARAAKVLGFKQIQTFILESEPGTSLKAAGWTFDGYTEGGDGWQSRERRRDDQPTCRKARWIKVFQPIRQQQEGRRP